MPGRPSLAAPQGGVVVSGQANISASGATTTINQSTNQAIINWQLFSIAPKETVNFNQPGPTSVTLNRVIGNEKSVIEGALNANGQVFIVNSAGIVFTKSAQVNVGGLVASTLDISNNNFMAGKYQFSGKSTASVINQGNIQASPGGYVALLGNTVSNQGTITATLGTVAMASGEQVTLNIGGNALVEVTTDKGTLNALVENKGAIVADGGQVILTARAADALLSAQVNNTGVIQARTMAGLTGGAPRKGSIKVVANGGRVRVAGRLDASAPNGGDGGTIETSGEKVTVADDAVITTKAASGKRGLWLIDPDGFTIASSGGDITGAALSSQLNNTDVTILSTQGSGTDGNINVNDTVNWSAFTTLTLGATNSINVNAPMSWSSGTLTLNAGKNVNVNAVLTAGILANFTANYGYELDQNGNPTGTQTTGANPDGSPYGLYTGLASTGGYAGQINFNGFGSVTLNGQNYTFINSAAGLAAVTSNPSGNYVLGSDIPGLSLAAIPAFSGSYNGFGHTLSLASVSTLSVDAPLSIPSLNNTNVVLNSAGGISINAPVTSGAGLLTLNAAGAINLNTSLQSANDSFGSFAFAGKSMTVETTASVSGSNVFLNTPTAWSSNAALTLAATNNIEINAPVSWTGGTLTLNAGKNIDVNAVMTATGAANFVASYGFILDTNGNPTTTTTPDANPDGTSYGLFTSLNSTGAYIGRIDFSGGGAVTLNGQRYTVINSQAGLITAGTDPSGDYVLGSDITISSLADIPTFTGNYNGFGHALPVASVSTLSIDAPLSIATLQNTNVVLNSRGDISINAPVTSGAGVLTFNAGGGINLNASLQSMSPNLGSLVFTGRSMTLDTTASVGGANIFLNAPTSWSSNAALTLAANDKIYINGSITATGANAGLVLSYGDDYVFKDASTSITLSGANPSLTINGNVYQLITTLAQLQAITPDLTKYYALGGDINAGGVSFSGPVVNDLEGTLAGLNHVVRNLTINDPTYSSNDALIGTLGTAGVVRDIGMVNTNVNAGIGVDGQHGGTASALVNTNNGTISNSYANGGLISGFSLVGGLVATNSGSISNSTTNIAVSGVTYVGGLVGSNNGGTIDNSSAAGPVSAGPAVVTSSSEVTSKYIGGLVGQNNGGSISNSHATGNVSATDAGDIGGLVGNNSLGSIKGSYASGSVTVTINSTGDFTSLGIGGLVGTNAGGVISNTRASGTVTVAVNNPAATAYNVGGLVGYNQSSFLGGGSIDSSSATGAVTGVVGTVIGVGGLVGTSDALSTVSNSTASGYVAVGEYPNAGLFTGGLIGDAQGGNSQNGSIYSGNSWSVSGTGQANAAGAAPTNDSTAGGATGTNPAGPSGPSTAPNFNASAQQPLEQSQSANVVANVDTAYSAATPPRPGVAASAGTAKTNALAGPSFSDTVSSPSNQTEGEWLTSARAKAASLHAPSRSDAREAKETPQRPRHAFVPRPIAKPKGAGFGATIHSIEIEGKQYELHEKSETKPQAPETKPLAPESKPQAPSDHN